MKPKSKIDFHGEIDGPEDAMRKIPTCSVCGNPKTAVGLFTPTNEIADQLGIDHDSMIWYGVCEEHYGDFETVEDAMLKDFATRLN